MPESSSETALEIVHAPAEAPAPYLRLSYAVRRRATWTARSISCGVFDLRPAQADAQRVERRYFTGEPIHQVMPLASTTPALRWP